MKIPPRLVQLLFLLFCANLSQAFATSIQPGGEKLLIILTPAKPTRQEQFAAQELAFYLEKATGKSFQIRTEKPPTQPFIAVAINGRLDNQPENLTFLSEASNYDAFQMRTYGKNLFLIGSNKRAVVYAVYSFLERIGYRWPSFGSEPDLNSTERCEEYTPKIDRLEIEPLDDYQQASFKFRGFVGQPWFGNTPTHIFDWMAKNRMNYFLFAHPESYEDAEEWRQKVILGGAVDRGIIIGAGHHSFSYFIRKNPSTPSEYFALKNGQRLLENKQICVFNQEVIDLASENVIAFLRKHSEVDILAFYPDDGLDWCECQGCMTPEKWAGDHKSQITTDSYQIFFNKVATKVREQVPNITLDRLAYVNYSSVPEKSYIPPKTNITYAVYWDRWNYTKPLSDNGYLPDVKKRIKSWVRATSGDVIIYEYYGGGHSSGWHGVQLHNLMAQEISHYHSLGVNGCITAAFWKYKDQTALINYVFARLLWNIDDDLQGILQDFALSRYGPESSIYMIKYFETMEKINHQTQPLLRSLNKISVKRLQNDCQKYLELALRTAITDKQKLNIENDISVYWNFVLWRDKE